MKKTKNMKTRNRIKTINKKKHIRRTRKGGSSNYRFRKQPFTPSSSHDYDEIQVEEISRMSIDERVKNYYAHQDTQCRICNKVFGFKPLRMRTNRHHCRNCYVSVCDDHFIKSKKICSVCDYFENEYNGQIILNDGDSWMKINYLSTLKDVRMSWYKYCKLYNMYNLNGQRRCTIKENDISGKIAILCKVPTDILIKIITMAYPDL